MTGGKGRVLLTSRTGFIEPEDFDQLWDQFITAIVTRDSQAIYTTSGLDHLNAPLDELKDALRQVSIKRKRQP